MQNVKAFPARIKGKPPKRIMRPCDWGLQMAVRDLEVQLGTIEAYNRIVAAAERLKKRIDAGDIKEQNPLYRSSVKG